MNNIDLNNFKRTDKIKKISRVCLSNSLLCFGSLLITFAFLELSIRLKWPQVFPPHPQGIYVSDNDLGYVLKPGFKGEFSGAEFHVPVSTNEQGLRGKNLATPSQKTFRVLCLGDSFTWGWGVNDDSTFPAVMEKFLQTHYQQLDIQVLNAGVPGYGTDEELEFLKKTGASLRPDLVIVQFFSGNDFDDNLYPANRVFEIRDEMLCQILDPGKDKTPHWLRQVYRLKQKSHFFHLASERAGYFLSQAGLLARLEKSSSEYFDEEDAERARNLLIEINHVVERLGADILFVFVPEKMQLLSKPKAILRAANVVRSAAAEAGAPWVDLTSSLTSMPDINELYFVQDAHWTSKGHLYVAQVLTERIIQLGLLDSWTPDIYKMSEVR